MVKLGKTFGNLMVDVQAVEREAARTRTDAPSRSRPLPPEDDVADAIAAADGDTKVAIVSLLAGVDAETARSRLDRRAAASSARRVADVVG